MAIRIADLSQKLRDALREWPEPEPAFDFHIGWSADYEALFRGEFVGPRNIDDLVGRALKHGRVMLHARGGGGKTVILRRLMREMLDSDALPLWVELREWTTPAYEAWKELDTPSRRLDFLLERYAVPPVTTVLLEGLPPGANKVLFVDGLNELHTGTAQEIIDSIEEFARRFPAGGVIIADRLVRRNFRHPDDWQLATVLPLGEEEIRHYLTQQRGTTALLDDADASTVALLGSPYFLDGALRSAEALTSAELHSHYFRRHVSLEERELAIASVAAYEAYRRNQSRSFSLAEFERDAGSDVVAKLNQAGALVASNDRAYFIHHLKHDYLVARYVAENPERWTEVGFTTATFDAASFEALAIALELLPTTKQGDLFVRRVYDWNQYGAAYAVAEGRHGGRIRVSPEMEMILLAMLADRRWDIISATAQRVTDALHLFNTVEARGFLDASSPEEIYRIVHERPMARAELLEWRDIFTRTPEQGVADSELATILNEDGLIGWTFANVLKRLHVSHGQQESLRKLLPEASRAARWRIAHSLGAFPGRRNARALLAILDKDEYMWARYGAVRSLLEMAARGDSDLREFIFRALEKRMSMVAQNARILPEFERAIFVDRGRAPKDWAARLLGLLNVLRSHEDSIERRDHWQEVAYRVRESYEDSGSR